MRSTITEEAIFTSKAAYQSLEWEKEQEILDALKTHFALQHAATFIEVEGYGPPTQVVLSHLEIDYGAERVYFKAIYNSVSDEHVGFALEELSKQDRTHCLQLRVVMEPDDIDSAPWLALKRPEDLCVKFGRELWKNARPVSETAENWSGMLTCALQLPGHTTVPDILADAWKAIEAEYVNNKNILLEDQIEEFEGSMTGGAFIEFDFKGNQLADLQKRLQSLSDDAKALGGEWRTEGFLYSDFAVLSFGTDKQGKIQVEYLSL